MLLFLPNAALQSAAAQRSEEYRQLFRLPPEEVSSSTNTIPLLSVEDLPFTVSRISDSLELGLNHYSSVLL